MLLTSVDLQLHEQKQQGSSSDKVQIGRLENIVGWYHSHPGYGCWLSGIDCQTQMTHQNFEDPFLAVVVRRDLPPPSPQPA